MSACMAITGLVWPEKERQGFSLCALCRQKYLQAVRSLSNTALPLHSCLLLSRTLSHFCLAHKGVCLAIGCPPVSCRYNYGSRIGIFPHKVYQKSHGNFFSDYHVFQSSKKVVQCLFVKTDEGDEGGRQIPTSLKREKIHVVLRESYLKK